MALAVTFLAADVILPDRLGNGVLDSADADAGLGGNPTDREIANAMVFDLTGDDRQRGPLAFGIDRPHLGRHATRSAQHASPLARLLAIGRAPGPATGPAEGKLGF